MNVKPWILYWLSNQGNKQGTGFPPDWTELGYEGTPDAIIDGFNYAKNIYDNWDSSITSMNNKYYNNFDLLIFPLVDTSNVSNFSSAFRDCSHLIYIPLLNTSNVTSMVRAFNGTSVVDFPLFDTSNVTNFDNTFNSNKSIKTLKQYNTSKATNFLNFVSNCSSLINFPVLDLGKATNLNNMVQNCNNLSNESLNNVMASLLTATSYAGTKTLKQVGISSAQATTCITLSNWTELSNAGWTTGY